MVQNSNGSSGEGAERQRRRAETRRREILSAAAHIFRQKGFSETGMREIAAAADLSPGNLYHYFEGKHELLFFCQDSWLDTMLGEIDRARHAEGTITERLRQVLEAHARCLLVELEGSVAHLEVDPLPKEMRDKLVAKRDLYERSLRELIEEGVKSGELVGCEPVLVTRAVLGALNWTARWFKPGGATSAQVVAGTLADYLVRGLAAQPAAELPARPARFGEDG